MDAMDQDGATVATVWLWVTRTDAQDPAPAGAFSTQAQARVNTPQPGSDAHVFERALFEVNLPLGALRQVSKEESRQAYFRQVQLLRKLRQRG